MSNNRINVPVLCALFLASVANAGQTFESKGRARFLFFFFFSICCFGNSYNVLSPLLGINSTKHSVISYRSGLNMFAFSRLWNNNVMKIVVLLVILLLRDEPEHIKCFSETLRDFTCFWEEARKNTDHTHHTFTFIYQYEWVTPEFYGTEFEKS